jgi:5-methylcytosine-specific restriction endonuclease McrA
VPKKPQYVRYDRPAPKRPSAAARGYGPTWRRLRLLKLARTPTCEMCDRAAVHVDHKDNNQTNNKWANLQSLCHSCHSIKTVHQDGGLGRAPATDRRVES